MHRLISVWKERDNVKIVISKKVFLKSDEYLAVHRWPVNISHPLTFTPMKIHKSRGWKQSLRDKSNRMTTDSGHTNRMIMVP
jgi:hypothetical protein